jgi:hypothetical protein
MSLFDNPKTSYNKFNGRLYYLEEMFKNFLKEENVTIEEIRQAIDKTTFRKFLIDHITINNPFGNLYQHRANNETHRTY